MRALVTGCAGFIGSHLTESLLGDGHTVVGIDCFNDNYQRPAKLRNLDHQAQHWDSFEFIPIDLARGDLDDLVSDADVVFHLAAEPGVRPSFGARFERYLQNNVLATQHLLESLVKAPRRRFVFASSSSIYGDVERLPTPETATPRPRSPYGVTKLTAEHLCQTYTANFDVDTVRLRYFTVYGPRQRPDMAFHRFLEAALRRETLAIYGDGRQTRDFTYVDDIVSATRAAATADIAPGSVFNLGGGHRNSVREVIDLVTELVGHPVGVRYVDSQWGDVRDTSADTGRARRELAFDPRTRLSDGLLAQLQWLRASAEATLAGRR